MEPIPDPALVVLIGPSGSGKSTWAEQNFRSEEVISSDRLRAIVGSGEHDLDASADAFAVLDQMVTARLKRRLLTVVDTLGLDDERRRRHLALAREMGLPAILVVFDVPEQVARERNRQRTRPVPASVLTSQIRRFRLLQARLGDEGWDLRSGADVVAIRPAHVLAGSQAPAVTPGGPQTLRPKTLRPRTLRPRTLRPRTLRPRTLRPRTLRVVLHLARFTGAGDLRTHLLSMAEAAEEAGFDGISLMDHLMQIPQVGREWEDFPEVFSALGFLAGRTKRLSLGALVANVRLRNPALLSKMLATIDVLSMGRTFCGLGAGWFKSEQAAYGYGFESPGRRLDRLEDALAILPLMWGPGKATYQGKIESVIEAVCYPRPIGKIPIIVGGSGPRTIKLAGSLADGLNLVGTKNLLEHIDLFRASAVEASRDPNALEVSVLDTPLLGNDRSEVAALVEANRGRLGASVFATNHNAGTVTDHIDRLRLLGSSGVGAIYISPVGLASPEAVAAWKPVVEALG